LGGLDQEEQFKGNPGKQFVKLMFKTTKAKWTGDVA
jgi:hypothetical protein